MQFVKTRTADSMNLYLVCKRCYDADAGVFCQRDSAKDGLSRSVCGCCAYNSGQVMTAVDPGGMFTLDDSCTSSGYDEVIREAVRCINRGIGNKGNSRCQKLIRDYGLQSCLSPGLPNIRYYCRSNMAAEGMCTPYTKKTLFGCKSWSEITLCTTNRDSATGRAFSIQQWAELILHETVHYCRNKNGIAVKAEPGTRYRCSVCNRSWDAKSCGPKYEGAIEERVAEEIKHACLPSP